MHHYDPSHDGLAKTLPAEPEPLRQAHDYYPAREVHYATPVLPCLHQFDPALELSLKAGLARGDKETSEPHCKKWGWAEITPLLAHCSAVQEM